MQELVEDVEVADAAEIVDADEVVDAMPVDVVEVVEAVDAGFTPSTNSNFQSFCMLDKGYILLAEPT